jgi:SAM-dependent methyltransferase
MADVLVDRAVVRHQYATDAHLAARQALWLGYGGPPLAQVALDLAGLRGDEVVVDVGCGNGHYLAELRRRGHVGRLLGLDLSEGMARHSGVHAPTTVADAQALPVRDGAADVALCMHMLYHVPDIPLAIAELRRVVRPGGTTLVSTNGRGHAGEVKLLLAEAARRVTGLGVDVDWDARRFRTDAAATHLRGAFADVAVHEVGSAVPVADPTVVSGFLASLPPEAVGLPGGEVWDAVLAAAGELATRAFAAQGGFTATSRAAVLVCR